MKVSNFKNYFAASAILGGTILGAGIFGLPYVFSRAGFLAGFFFLIVVCFITTTNHLIYGESLLRTKGEHRFPGLAKIYLGQWGLVFTTALAFIGIGGVLLAYLLLGGQFVQNFSQIINKPLTLNQATLLFWSLGTLGIILGIRLISWGEILGLILMIFLIVVFFILGAPNVNPLMLAEINFSQFFLPYGVLLFALSGGAAVPEIFNYFKKTRLSPQEISFKKPIIWGSVLPAFLYFLFVYGIFGVLGIKDIPVDIVPPLVKINPFWGITTDILGIVLILTSYFILGLVLRNILFFDLKTKNIISWLVPIILPPFLYFSGLTNFIRVISFVGAVVLGIEFVLNLIIHHFAQKRGILTPAFQIRIPSALRIFLAILLLIGVSLEIAKFF